MIRARLAAQVRVGGWRDPEALRHDGWMDVPISRLEAILGHPVIAALAPEDGPLWGAVSLSAPPVRVRVAWVDSAAGEGRARVSCPPGVPSPWRPGGGAGWR